MLKEEKKYLYLIFLMILVFRIPTFYQPIFDIDESFFAEFAKSILNGGLPYINAVDNKSPLLLYFIAGVFKLFGSPNLIFVHIMTAILVVLTVYVIFICGKTIKDSKTGLWAAFIFGILTNVYEPKNVSTNIETLSNLMIALTFLFYLNYLKNKKKVMLFSMLTGISIGIGLLIQWQAGILVILLVLYSLIFEVFLSGKKNKIYQFLTELKFLIIAGFFILLPVVLMSLYFLKKGCLDAFLFWTLEYNFTYAKAGDVYIPIYQTFMRIGIFVACSFPVWSGVFFYFKNYFKDSVNKIRSNMKEMDQKVFFFLLLSIFALFYIVTLGKRAYGHYFLLLFTPLSLAAAIYFKNKDRKNLKEIITLLVFGFIFFVPRIHLDSMYRFTGNSFGKADMEYVITANYLKQKANPNDKIIVWGYGTPIYYYSNLAPATRFLSSDTLVGRLSIPDSMRVDVNELLRKNPYSAKLWELFMEDLKNNQPRYFIDTSPANYYGYGRFRIQSYLQLNQYISDNYNKIRTLGLFDIYERKNKIQYNLN